MARLYRQNPFEMFMFDVLLLAAVVVSAQSANVQLRPFSTGTLGCVDGQCNWDGECACSSSMDYLKVTVLRLRAGVARLSLHPMSLAVPQFGVCDGVRLGLAL